MVMPVYNAGQTIAQSVAALMGQDFTGSWELVLVDNNSSDDGIAQARETVEAAVEPPPLVVVPATARQGVGYARNAGVEASRGDVVLICDADDIVVPGWISAMVDALDEADLVGGPLDIQSLQPSLSGPWRPAPPADRLPGDPPFAPGGNFGARTELIRRVGGWREDLPYGEDVEFSWRAADAGARLAFAEGALVLYRLPTDARSIWRQSVALGRAGALLRGMDPIRGGQPRAVGTQIWWLVTRLPGALGGGWRQAQWCRNGGQLWGQLSSNRRAKPADGHPPNG